MFIQPDKTIINIDYVPDGVAGWLVSGDLAQKISAAYPYFDFVTEGGALVDITPTVRPSEPVTAPSAEEQLRADVDYIALMAGVTL